MITEVKGDNLKAYNREKEEWTILLLVSCMTRLTTFSFAVFVRGYMLLPNMTGTRPKLEWF